MSNWYRKKELFTILIGFYETKEFEDLVFDSFCHFLYVFVWSVYWDAPISLSYLLFKVVWGFYYQYCGLRGFTGFFPNGIGFFSKWELPVKFIPFAIFRQFQVVWKSICCSGVIFNVQVCEYYSWMKAFILHSLKYVIIHRDFTVQFGNLEKLDLLKINLLLHCNLNFPWKLFWVEMKWELIVRLD